MNHKVCFHGEIRKNIMQVPLFIWSYAKLHVEEGTEDKKQYFYHVSWKQ